MKAVFFLFTVCFLFVLSTRGQAQQKWREVSEACRSVRVLERLPVYIQPVIGAWFWSEKEFEPDGYKHFIDQMIQHSCYDLLSASIRLPGRDITDIDVHNQVKLAVAYGKEKGIRMAFELDPRLARRKFEAAYPDELQESLWLEEVSLSEDKPVEVVVRSISLSDHMTGRKTPYISLHGSLLRVYSYTKTTKGIEPSSLRDITGECRVTVSSSDSLVVCLPANSGSNRKQACVMVSFTHLYPDVFAPHLQEFTREIIRAYSDVPMAGGMRDEWGFPPSTPADRMASGKHFWYSRHYASAYAKKTGGRELLADCLLMHAGINGQEKERQMAINHYMEMNLQRNSFLEDDFYHAVKEVFGADAAVVTHPTWYPYPDRLEYKKNGLDWWTATRDWAQTDEITPFAARTSLAKKWGSPVWYNQYYSTEVSDYGRELWSAVLAGGRINYHPLYPRSDLKTSEKYFGLLRDSLMQGESRVRLLNFISGSPLDCPVAVIFGHPAAMNWAGPYFEDPGMELVDSLWSMGIPTDLIPTGEIENGSLLVGEDGWIHYGKQRYAAVILYNPEFEKPPAAEFFNRAAGRKTQLFRIGNWTRDFDGNTFDGAAALPREMTAVKDIKAMIPEVLKVLKKQKIELQTPATRILKGFGHVSSAPPTQGFCRLTDGTLIQAAGTHQVSGDPINSRVKAGKYDVAFTAVGIAAVRFDEEGQVQALAAGGLTSFKTQKTEIHLEEPVDLAFWQDERGAIKGVIQGLEGEIPQPLLSLTKDWLRLKAPVPLSE
ncbi:MAG: hypothetical protein PHI28_07995 [Mangrovibacterium sp.]|nr:hypothetical protein [Mangrovibacterium sp.]